MNKTRGKRAAVQETSEDESANQPLFRIYEARRRNSLLLPSASPAKDAVDRSARSSAMQAASSYSPCKRKKKFDKHALHTTPKKSLTPYVIFVKKVRHSRSYSVAATERNRHEQPHSESSRPHEGAWPPVAGALAGGKALLRSMRSEG